jgi:hypothetical protein
MDSESGRLCFPSPSPSPASGGGGPGRATTAKRPQRRHGGQTAVRRPSAAREAVGPEGPGSHCGRASGRVAGFGWGGGEGMLRVEGAAEGQPPLSLLRVNAARSLPWVSRRPGSVKPLGRPERPEPPGTWPAAGPAREQPLRAAWRPGPGRRAGQMTRRGGRRRRRPGLTGRSSAAVGGFGRRPGPSPGPEGRAKLSGPAPAFVVIGKVGQDSAREARARAGPGTIPGRIGPGPKGEVQKERFKRSGPTAVATPGRRATDAVGGHWARA